jgi:ABC-type nitrate/sulfonate/bicarbonate transport system substrate-binding protein
VKEVQDGRADIAITKLVTAWELAKREKEVTNVAQIIQGSGVVVVCRISAGVYKLERDLAGKRIGIFDSGEIAC